MCQKMCFEFIAVCRNFIRRPSGGRSKVASIIPFRKYAAEYSFGAVLLGLEFSCFVRARYEIRSRRAAREARTAKSCHASQSPTDVFYLEFSNTVGKTTTTTTTVPSKYYTGKNEFRKSPDPAAARRNVRRDGWFIAISDEWVGVRRHFFFLCTQNYL